MIALISCGGLQPVERRPLHARGGTANEVDRAAETKTHTKNLFQKNILKGVLVFLSCLSFRLVLEIGRPIARSSQPHWDFLIFLPLVTGTSNYIRLF